MIETNIILLSIAGVFLIGFLGNLFFRKTKISDIFFLILIGFLLGPGLNIIPENSMILLKSFSPFFGSLALLMLLFDGGLYLNFNKVLKELKNATVFTILVFLFSLAFIGVILFFVFKIPLIYGLLIGSIFGSTSATALVPLIKGSVASEETKTLLTLEAALNDSLSVVLAIAILDIIISQSTNVQVVAQSIFSAYAIAIVIGLLSAIIWISVLKRFSYAKEYGYMLTFSFLIIIFILTEFLKGNGAITALIFGIVLGNHVEFFKSFNLKSNKKKTEEQFDVFTNIKKFQTEFSLFIKTFFYIYLGIIVDFSGFNFKTALLAFVLLFITIFVRFFIVKVFYKKNKTMKKDQTYLVGLHARGLSTAVLATFPLAMGIDNEITNTIALLAFMFIILTNLSTTVMLFLTEKKQKKIKKK